MTAFGTKAETLHSLTGTLIHSSVPDLYYFTVGHWVEAPEKILSRLEHTFKGARLAIRSSALNEDSAASSMAGAYRSELDVDGSDNASIVKAVSSVIRSYGSDNPMNQVLVQRMLTDVALSGVAMTHDLTSGAPYYIINYDDESGKTDAITGGTGINKTVMIHHDAHIGSVESKRIVQIVKMIKELEDRFEGHSVPLDIEFAQTADGRMHLLQLRRIAVRKNWNHAVKARISGVLERLSQFIEANSIARPGISGSRTVLGQMPDWNPAELIGTKPSPLAVSLFRQLVSDMTWQQARAGMGYKPVPGEPLMLTLAGRPYIDVRNSFNSFLPTDLSASQETAIVDAWLERLAQHPEFHDKIEFEVAQTLVDFNFDRIFSERYRDTIGESTAKAHKRSLLKLTARNVTPGKQGSLATALAEIEGMDKIPVASVAKGGSSIRRCLALLDLTMSGTLRFSVIARHAFMAEALMRSAATREAWSQERMDLFKASIAGIASQMGSDFKRVIAGKLSKEKFLSAYGHLRPGTFDIMSLRYDQRDGLFSENANDDLDGARFEHGTFQLDSLERKSFKALLDETGIPVSPEDLLAYARMAISGREYAKFVFTKSLSAALELIADWGEDFGLTREHLSFLTIYDLADTLISPPLSDPETFFVNLAESRRQQLKGFDPIRLNYLIRDPHDIMVIPLHRGAPNFVSRRKVSGEPVVLDGREDGMIDVFRKIVCIGSADPGYDWIFTRNILGLVTKFGGANSHMTIRCAELGLPAAIGVGEHTFDWLTKADRIMLDCAGKEIRPIHD